MKYTQRRNSFSRFVPILLVIVITVVAVAAVIAIGRALFGKNDSGQTTDQNVNVGQVALLSTDAGSAVRLTVRGPIVADETFRSYQIEISPNKRTYTVYQGYLDKQLDRKEFENNQQAYEQLVYALSKAQIQDTRTVDDDDVRGVCATGGRLYTFGTMDSGVTKTRIWTSSCQGSPGSMKADVPKIHALFANQIPGFAPMFDKTQ